LFLVYQPGWQNEFRGGWNSAFGYLCAENRFARLSAGRHCDVGMIFFFSRNKAKTIIFVLPMIAVALLLLPSATMHRLLLFWNRSGIK